MYLVVLQLDQCIMCVRWSKNLWEYSQEIRMLYVDYGDMSLSSQMTVAIMNDWEDSLDSKIEPSVSSYTAYLKDYTF